MEIQSSIVKGKTIKQVQKINLSGLGLTEIPTEVFIHTNLTKLVLSRNAIKRIPKEIAKLKKLEVLDLTYNELTSLPAPVFKLPKLRVFAVGHNKITRFPAQIVGSSIKELIADHNQIKEIAPEALNGLTKLVISNNPLGGRIVTQLLPKLEYYDFRNTDLETPIVEFTPAVKKRWLPIHPIAITQKINKEIVDSVVKEKKDIMGKGCIFISHSSKDKAVIESFVDYILQLGIGLPVEKISCTSIQGMGIQNGAKMREWIQEKIETCSLALLMMSTNYKASEICLNEMGAIWALNKPVKILLLPGVEYDNFGWLEEIRQAGHIDQSEALDELYDELTEEFRLIKKAAVWNNNKMKFLEGCKAMKQSVGEDVSDSPWKRFSPEEMDVFFKWAHSSGGNEFKSIYTKDCVTYRLGGKYSYCVERGEKEAEWEEFFNRLFSYGFITVRNHDSYGYPIYKITKKGYEFAKELVNKKTKINKWG